MKRKKFITCILAGAMALSAALAGCGGIDANATGATLNGKEISLGFMNFMAKYQQAICDVNYSAYLGDGMWSAEMGTDDDGNAMTMTQSVKKSVVDNIETLYLLEEHMADYGVTVTEEELAKAQEAAAAFLSDNSDKAIKQMGATQEYVAEMLRLYTIQKKMTDAIYAEVDSNVTDEEAAQRTFTYIRASVTSGKDAEGNSVDYDEEQKAALEARMQETAASAKADFDGAVEAIKDDQNLSSSTYSYGTDESVMEQAVVDAANALKEGEVSELITTEKYFYVIRLDSEFDREATDKKKESIVSQRQSDHFTEVCDGYKEKAEYTVDEGAWEKVAFDKLFSAAPTDTE